MNSLNNKAQSKKLKEALNKEKSQGGAIRRLKSLDDLYDLELTAVQKFLIDNQNNKESNTFVCFKHCYTETQKQKVEQLQRIKEKKELLTKTRYNVVYDDKTGEITQKTFGDKEKAEKYVNSSRLRKLEIKEVETPISTNFTPNEMLKITQKVDKAFHKIFSEPKNITIAMVKRAIGMEVSATDKKVSTSKRGKKKVA